MALKLQPTPTTLSSELTVWGLIMLQYTTLYCCVSVIYQRFPKYVSLAESSNARVTVPGHLEWTKCSLVNRLLIKSLQGCFHCWNNFVWKWRRKTGCPLAFKHIWHIYIYIYTLTQPQTHLANLQGWWSCNVKRFLIASWDVAAVEKVNPPAAVWWCACPAAQSQTWG